MTTAVLRFLDGTVEYLAFRPDGRLLDYELCARFVIDIGGKQYGDVVDAPDMRITGEPRGDREHRELRLRLPDLPGGLRPARADCARAMERLEGELLARYQPPPGEPPTPVRDAQLDLGHVAVEVRMEVAE